MAALFGVHVGNSSACLAICKDEDRVNVVANDAGDRITPTALQWTPNGCTMGRTAQLELFRNSMNTIVRNKQVFNGNVSEDELSHLRSKVQYKINQSGAEVKYELLYEGKQHHITPREVTGWIFKNILPIAQSAVGGSKEINVVIAVPLYYSQKSIQLTKDMATKAGFNVLQVVDEASTAALGSDLCLDPQEPPHYCMVYRVGGVSIDATILLVQDGMFSVVDSIHKQNLGGSSLTEKLSDFLASEFKRQYRTAEISERGKYKLMAAAETAKQVLSIQNVAQCSCESIGNGYDFSCSISRARFENVIASLVPEIVEPIVEVLKRSNLTSEKIRKVVICGGTMKTPKLIETVQKLLPTSEVVNSCPDEVIALGAAKQAGYLTSQDQMPETLAVDTPSLSTSLLVRVKTEEDADEVCYPIPENSVVPLRKTYDVVGSTVTASLTDDSGKSLGSATVNNSEPNSKTRITLDIAKEGKILLTLTNQATKEKTHVKCDLSDLSNI